VKALIGTDGKLLDETEKYIQQRCQDGAPFTRSRVGLFFV